MILTHIIAFAFVAAPLTTPVQIQYNYSLRLTHHENLPTLVSREGSNTPVYINSSITWTCDLSFNDVSDYSVTNYHVVVDASYYYLNANNLDVSYSDGTIGIDFNPRLPYSNNLGSDIDELSLVIKTTVDDDFDISFNYGLAVLDSDSYVLDSSPHPVSLTCTFNSSSFFSSIERCISSYASQNSYDQGKEDGLSEGYQNGFRDGVTYAQNQDQTALTIFEGIVTVALVPINFFLAIFNFEIFGINISGFVSALLTVSVVIIIVRLMTGKKASND